MKVRLTTKFKKWWKGRGSGPLLKVVQGDDNLIASLFKFKPTNQYGVKTYMYKKRNFFIVTEYMNVSLRNAMKKFNARVEEF